MIEFLPHNSKNIIFHQKIVAVADRVQLHKIKNLIKDKMGFTLILDGLLAS